MGLSSRTSDELRQSTQLMSLSQIKLDCKTREATVEFSSFDADTDWIEIASLDAAAADAAAADLKLHTRSLKVAVLIALYRPLLYLRCTADTRCKRPHDLRHSFVPRGPRVWAVAQRILRSPAQTVSDVLVPSGGVGVISQHKNLPPQREQFFL